MPIVNLADVTEEQFTGGATYKTVVGDEEGSTPIRLGVQTSPPGYKTPLHSHPYMETITIIDGQGEAWMENEADVVALRPGMTLVLPPNVRHWFRTVGDSPLVTLGVHASPRRIVAVHER